MSTAAAETTADHLLRTVGGDIATAIARAEVGATAHRQEAKLLRDTGDLVGANHQENTAVVLDSARQTLVALGAAPARQARLGRGVRRGFLS